MVQLSHPYMTTGKIIALTIWTFVRIVMSLLFKTLAKFVISFLPRSKCFLISWLQFSSAVYSIQSINSADVSILVSQEGGPILECAFVLLVKYQLMIQQKSWKEKSLPSHHLVQIVISIQHIFSKG